MADTSYVWFQLDVFAPRAGTGNPLGVVIADPAWSDHDMQALAAWTNLVETTFVLPATQPEADYRVRIFTPSREIPFAGHPSLGTAHAVRAAGLVAPERDRLIQECAAGLLPISIERGADGVVLFVRSPPATVVASRAEDSAAVCRVLHGLRLGALPPALVAGGRRWWLAEIASEAELRGLQADPPAIKALALASDSVGLCLFARAQDADYDLVVRAFPCAIGINEDPASGAANGLIASYLHHAEPSGRLLANGGYRVSQGREIGRDARLELRIAPSGTVEVGGQVQTVVEGRLRWPLAPVT